MKRRGDKVSRRAVRALTNADSFAASERARLTITAADTRSQRSPKTVKFDTVFAAHFGPAPIHAKNARTSSVACAEAASTPNVARTFAEPRNQARHGRVRPRPKPRVPYWCDLPELDRRHGWEGFRSAPTGSTGAPASISVPRARSCASPPRSPTSTTSARPARSPRRGCWRWRAGRPQSRWSGWCAAVGGWTGRRRRPARMARRCAWRGGG